MRVYQVDQIIVERNSQWDDLKKYIEEEALNHQAHEIEEHILKRLLCIGKHLLREVFFRFDAQKSKPPMIDGKFLPYHKRVTRLYLSIFGLVSVERASYWRLGTNAIHPLDIHFNLPKRRYSHLLVKWTQDGVAEGPYDEGIQRIYEILGIKLCKREQEILSQEVSRDVEQFYREPCTENKQTAEGSIIIASTDCKGVVMIPKERTEPTKAKFQQQCKARDARGRKGLKRDAVVTADYTINPEKRTPKEVIELLMRSDTKEKREKKKRLEKEKRLRGEGKPREPINKRVMASLEGKASAFKDLADRIERRDPQGLKPIFVQVDGAKSLEKGILQEFKKRGWKDRIIGVGLDIIHVMEYIWELSTSLHGETSPERIAFVKKIGLAILEGKVGYVIGGLKQMQTKGKERLYTYQKKALKKTLTYFENHKHMMRYDEYLAKGLPIATGVIEGTCGSLVKDRMERSGMKWSHDGAQAVLNLRALKRNGDWDDYWDYYLEKEHERLYEQEAA